jgi:ferredoxin-NADP reductase
MLQIYAKYEIDALTMVPVIVWTLSSLLAILVTRCLVVAVLDALQSRKASLAKLAGAHEQSLRLGSALRRTYVDLSMRTRQTVWRDVMVVKIVQESEDVRSFYLVDANHDPLPVSQPGQHLLLERPELGDLPKEFRCYSLSDDHTAGHWRISVKKNSEFPASVSRWLHESVGVGELLRVRGPSGAFYMRTEPDRHVALVSAGIGVTPMIPMLIESIRRKQSGIRVFCQFRDVAHLPFAELLVTMGTQYPSIDLNLWISRFPKGVKKRNGKFFYEGKFQAAELLSRPGAKNNTDYYLCGPEEWQTRLRDDLVAGGVAEDQIDFELFQPSETKVAAPQATATHRVMFKQTGSSATFDNEHPNILGCASKNKVPIDSGCRMGACGSCAVRLLQGKVRYTREPQFPLKSNEILACVCVPETDLVLDA